MNKFQKQKKLSELLVAVRLNKTPENILKAYEYMEELEQSGEFTEFEKLIMRDDFKEELAR